MVRFSQTLQNCLKVSIGNDVYNFTMYDRIHITETTKINYPNSGGDLLKQWTKNCNDKNKNGKTQNFLKLTKSSSPTGYSGATSLPPIGHSFLNIETSQINPGREIVFVSFDRTVIVETSNITF